MVLSPSIIHVVIIHKLPLPLCCRYRSYQRGHWSEHYWALMASVWQLVGTVFYWGCEWSEGFKHIELVSCSSTLE